MSHPKYSLLVEKPFLQQKQEMQSKPTAFPAFAVFYEKRAVDAVNCALLILLKEFGVTYDVPYRQEDDLTGTLM